MEVLFITHKYPPSIGGMEQQSYQLVNGMRKLTQVHLIAYDPRQESRFSFFAKLRYRVLTILRANSGIKLIHLNDGLMAAFYLMLVGETGVPTVSTFHGLDVVFPLQYFQNKVLPRFRNLSACIGVSSATSKALCDRNISAKNVFTIVNGVGEDLDKITTSMDFIPKMERRMGKKIGKGPLLLLVGRPVRRKGFSWFINKILPSLPHDHQVMIISNINRQKSLRNRLKSILPTGIQHQLDLFMGAASDAKPLRAAIDQYPRKNQILHLNSCTYEDLLSCMHLADLFLMPNVPVMGDMEGFGLVALEANACGTPVLASDLEGIKDAVVQGVTGWRIPAGDRVAWVHTIYEKTADREALNRIGRNATDYVGQHFSWSQMVLSYYYTFKEVIAHVKDQKKKYRSIYL